MKLRLTIAGQVCALFLLGAPWASLARETGTNVPPAAAKDSAASSTNAPVVEPPLPVAVFELTAEARDPFFPQSLRQAVKKAATNSVAFSPSNFTLKGLSGLPGHRLAVINNRTFAVGEKWEVTTPTGKFPVTCDEIRAESVIIRLDSQLEPIELSLRKAAQ